MEVLENLFIDFHDDDVLLHSLSCDLCAIRVVLFLRNGLYNEQDLLLELSGDGQLCDEAELLGAQLYGDEVVVRLKVGVEEVFQRFPVRGEQRLCLLVLLVAEDVVGLRASLPHLEEQKATLEHVLLLGQSLFLR